jgi:ATPase domain predominantly from Archaea
MAYIYGTPVTGSEFYGREPLLTELTQFSSSTTYFLNGIRRIGKSSMLKEIERLTKNAGYASLYIDLLGGYSSEDFGAELCRIIENYFYDNKIEFIEDEWVDLNFENAFEKWTQYCQENNKKSFLLIDEAEKLHKMTPKNMELLTKRISDYRPIVQVILTGTRLFWRYDPTDRPDLTAFQDLLTQQYIGMVSQEDATHIVTRKKADKQIVVSENDFDKIWEACGGHPYLLQYVCGSHHKTGDVNFSPFNTPIPSNDQLKNVFLNDFGLFDENHQFVLKSIVAQQNQGISGHTELINFGVVAEVPTGYKIYARLFEDWLHDYLNISINNNSKLHKIVAISPPGEQEHKYLDDFVKHCILPFESNNMIIYWDTTKIQSSDIREKVIEKEIKTAYIVIGLISSAYLSNKETKEMQALAIVSQKKFIPVLVMPCLFQINTEIGGRSYIPLNDGIPHPVQTWPKGTEDAWYQVSQHIHSYL